MAINRNDDQFQNAAKMKVRVVSHLLSYGDECQRLQAQLILQCAPFLKGMKAACAVSLSVELCGWLARVLKDTGISCRTLAAEEKRRLVIFYRETDFAAYLRREDVADFLEEYGYETGAGPRKALERLAGRFRRYSEGRSLFPHEIGAFLDYPIADVEGFIRNAGKNYLLSGYWKVYHCPAAAQMIFYAYDKARAAAVNEYLTGTSLRGIAAGGELA